MESQKETDFRVLTIPSIPGYKITKVIELINGLSPKPRGIGSVLKGALQSTRGGEVTAFMSKIEKTRVEAIAPGTAVNVRSEGLLFGCDSEITINIRMHTRM